MRNEQGFTLIEVMIAMIIYLLILASMLPVFVSFTRLNTLTEIRTEAASAGAFVLDQLRLLDPITMPASGSDPAENIVVGTRTYSVVTSYCSDVTYCNTNNNRHILIQASYKGQVFYEVETVFTQLR